MTRVFGIGLSKTGTTSLDAALARLGLRTEHYFFDLHRLDADGDLQAGTDIPVTRAWKELDRRHPGAKFVLTVREEASWLESCRKHFGPPIGVRNTELRLDVYGSVEFEPSRFRRIHRRHVRAVRRYFRGRPGDLLVMDICAGAGWEVLCPFLGRPVPDEPFPHRNPAAPTTGA